MTTNPARANNAIDEIAFIVLLSRDIDEETLRIIEGIHQNFVAHLPKVERINGMKVAFGNNAPSVVSQEVSGIHFFKNSDNSDKRLELSLRIEGKNIIVACSEYTSWNHVWPKALNIISDVLNTINLQNNPVSEIVYQCLDKFRTKLETNKYEVDAVFDTKSKYLTQRVISDNARSWHIHQGWFSQNLAEDARVLNNLNINSLEISNDIVDTQINHIIKIRKPDSAPITSIEELLGKDRGYLNLTINQAHTINKEVVTDILNRTMLQAIGLEQGIEHE